MSFTHPRDVAKALFRVATAGEGGKVYQVKSFDATAEELARGVIEACGKKVQVKREGLFSKTTLPADYTPFGTITSGLNILQTVAKAGTTCTYSAGGGVPKEKVIMDSVSISKTTT